MQSKSMTRILVCCWIGFAHAWILPERTRTIVTTIHQSQTQTSSTRLYVDRKQELLNFINRDAGNTVGDEPPTVSPEEDDLADLVRTIVKAGDDRKAEDIVAMRVSKVSTLTSFIVLLSGSSRPQNQAIAASIMDALEEKYNMRPLGNGVPEGTADSGWMVLDYGSVMVHVMTPKSRLYYNIEGKFGDEGGEYMDISSVIVPNSVSEASGTMEVAKEDDPFWS